MTSRAVRTGREGEVNQVRRIAVAAQEVLLRPVPDRLGPVRAASMYLAAETGAQIGGDLRAAAVVMGAFRESVHYEDDLVEVIKHCGAALRRDAAARARARATVRGWPTVVDDLLEGFVAALVAQILDSPDNEVINRGHPPPLLLHTDGVIEARDADRTFFELAEAMAAMRDHTRTAFLSPVGARFEGGRTVGAALRAKGSRKC